MRLQTKLITGCILTVWAAGAWGQMTAPQSNVPGQAEDSAVAQSPSEGLGRFLADMEKPEGPEVDEPYGKVPPALEEAVRMVAMDNFSSATVELLKQLQAAETDEDKTFAHMWLGLNYGSQAITYPNTGWKNGTSATAHLREAIKLDPQVFLAPDVARILAEMVAHGWGNEDPATALQRAEQKAEETRRANDFYFAGVISRRLAARAWGYSDTTEQDQKTLSLFAKSVAREPRRYEAWSAYLPAMLPAGMHDLATTEAIAMYDHFENLRTPLIAEQGPAVLKLSVSSYRTIESDQEVLDSVSKKWPDAPMPPFETAMRAIETSPPLAMELFPKLIADFESGELKPLPREAGYYPSALYKYAFLLQSVGRLEESIDVYEKVREVSPGYAEVNMNIGILYTMMAEQETTGARKIELLEMALPYVEAQEELDYRGRAALKAGELRQRLRSVLYRLRNDANATGTTATVTGI